MPGSRLYYHGSRTEVCLGDRVICRTLILRKKRVGTVSAIPTLTANELARSGKNADTWWIRFDNGTVTGWIYAPEEVQPSPRVSFLGRAGSPPVQSSDAFTAEIEAAEASEENQVGPKSDAALMAALLLIGLSAIGLWAWVRG